MEIVARKGNFIVTESKGKRFVWEKVKSGKDHIVFQHFEGQLYARYDSHHTPSEKGHTPLISVKEWHALQRAEAKSIMKGLLGG